MPTLHYSAVYKQKYHPKTMMMDGNSKMNMVYIYLLKHLGINFHIHLRDMGHWHNHIVHRKNRYHLFDSLLSLLSKLLQHLEIMKNNDHHHQPKIIYLHCWGGIGRAALVGSCLASLLYPELTANEILDWVQRGYDTRVTAKSSNGTPTCICKRICWWGTNIC